jgi:Alginate export
MSRFLTLSLALPLLADVGLAQQAPAADDSDRGLFRFTLEERTRWEERYGVNFGKSVNQQDMLSRVRVGVEFDPAPWISFYTMGQDARVPFYGAVAPATIRDTMDLQELTIKILDRQQTGFGAALGRSMLDYGESRVIGTPQWTNVARTYDQGRLYWRSRKARYEFLVISPVKVLPDSFNKPEWGERIWGTYDVFTDLSKRASADVYVLRHSQNKIGGWTGAGTLGTDSFGGRLYGPLVSGLAYSFEGIGQTGHLGPVPQRAYAWFSGVSETFKAARRTVKASAEYKVASGTYDQLAPANHDKFGHEDLFGWRNLKTFRSLETIGITRSFTWNVMYTNDWLHNAADGLYNGPGSLIAISKTGVAGTHVGQEVDSFVTYEYRAHTFGAGVGHFFKGEFVANASPHINPRYFYVFQQFSLN